ncbi:MAG: transcriptional repressor NrdR [Deltaproteobacteria bacterium]|nr:transcriptional repressor NrdR [Deltaproteobacteria bacterium]
MKCPFCAHIEDKVIDSRLSNDGNVTRRRRECLGCTKRFTTYERLGDMLPMVVKKNGARVVFDRSRILDGIKKACEKRPVSIEDIELEVDRLEGAFIESGTRELSSSDIGEAVMNLLRRLDEVAYVRFASVYREFRDINEFMSEMKELVDNNKKKK